MEAIMLKNIATILFPSAAIAAIGAPGVCRRIDRIATGTYRAANSTV
jgi:hypothetical protein